VLEADTNVLVTHCTRPLTAPLTEKGHPSAPASRQAQLNLKVCCGGGCGIMMWEVALCQVSPVLPTAPLPPDAKSTKITPNHTVCVQSHMTSTTGCLHQLATNVSTKSGCCSCHTCCFVARPQPAVLSRTAALHSTTARQSNQHTTHASATPSLPNCQISVLNSQHPTHGPQVVNTQARQKPP